MVARGTDISFEKVTAEERIFHINIEHSAYKYIPLLALRACVQLIKENSNHRRSSNECLYY